MIERGAPVDRMLCRWPVQAVIALAATLLLTVEYWAFGPDSAMYGYGGSLETVPVYLGLLKTDSAFSFWTPIVAGGVDRLSFWGNADPFNVETLLYGGLPTWLAAAAQLGLQRFIPMLFTMRVAHEQLGLTGVPTVIAGLLYGLLTYPAPGYMLAEASIPLAIWLLAHLARRRWGLAAALPAGLAIATMTSFVWSMPIVPCVLVAWFLLVRLETARRPFLAIALFCVGLAVGDLPQFLALSANAPASHRANWPVEEIAWSWRGLFYFQTHYDLFNQDPVLKRVTIALPLAGLLVGLPLALLRWRRDGEARLLARLALLYCLVSAKVLLVAVQLAAAGLFPALRGLYMGRFHDVPAPFLIPLILSLAVLMASRQAAEWLPAPRVWRAAGLLLVTAGMMFLAVRPKQFLFADLMLDGWNQRHYEVAALEGLVGQEQRPFRVASVLPLQPAYAYGQGLEAADGWANLYPSRYRDLWLRLVAPGMAALPGMRAVLDPAEGRPQDHYIFLNLDLVTPGIGALPVEAGALRDGFELTRRIDLDLLSLLNVQYVLSAYPLRGPGLVERHAPDPPPDELRSRDYATGRDNAIPPLSPRDPLARPGAAWAALRDALERRRAGKDIYVYENTRVLRRFRLVERVAVLPDADAVLDWLSRAPVETLATDAAVALADLPSADEGAVSRPLTGGEVSVILYTSDRIELALSLEGPGYLVVGNTWNPYWTAMVDGSPGDLMPANHAQTGLAVSAGARRVVLRYQPPYTWLPFLGRSAADG